MADTRNTTLTIAGMNLLAKTQQGKELHFTRVMMGDGKIPEGMNIKDMTEMVNPILKLPIGNIRLDGTGTSVMECILKNAELEQGFFARELGIFANDPDTGEELLYAIRNTGDYSEYIPAASSGEVINFVYSVITVVGQSENVTGKSFHRFVCQIRICLEICYPHWRDICFDYARLIVPVSRSVPCFCLNHDRASRRRTFVLFEFG